jgi:AmmeMemoRadiSam system protein A
MAPSACIELTTAEQARLLTIARRSLATGLETRRPLDVDTAALTGTLAEPHGNFVTLTRRGVLRGCVGTLIGTAPLAQGVANSAYNAGFNDQRFPPLSAAELDQTQIDISVLSQPQPLIANDLSELLEQLHPREHGLIVEDRGHRATLLPKVWEKVPDAKQFITELLAKAGLPPYYWSDTIRFFGYKAFEFAEAAH